MTFFPRKECNMIAVVDYDAGNIMSVCKALDFLGEKYIFTRNKSDILGADRVILPGVGAFGDAVKNLDSFELTGVLKDFVSSGKPFLGICLGMQLLFEKSEESKEVTGLSFLRGECLRIPSDTGLKVPQIGWNSLSFPKESKLFKGIPDNSFVYFVHSYYVRAFDRSDVAAECDYGVTVHAAVEHDNIFGCQFHPEKSSDIGLSILKNFATLKV